MLGLCKSILTQNKIYENTTALEVERSGNNYIIHTDKGDIETEKIVIATHYPILNMPGFYFTKMYQSTSYVIAIEANQKIPYGMFISAKEPIYSFRTAKYQGKDILLICGSDHKTGEAIATNEKYKELEDLAKKYYPDCNILFRWNTRDCISLDKIPYIGEFSSFMKGVYVGTGFKKWGMAFSNVSANIIVDDILGKENEYKEIFNSKRMKPVKNRWEVKNMVVNTANNLVFDKFRIEPYNIEQIANDNGAIIEKNGDIIGVYKDMIGKVYAVKPICTHLGCLLTWNNTDKTWDCPCHGSRFDYMGKNIYEPAIKGLKTNYLKIGGISEEDKQRLEQLESSMNIVANENGLQKLASQLSTKISERYDIESEQSETQQDEQNSIKDRLEAYRGAIDAEVQALKIGKISKAKRCQKRANMLMQQIESDDIQRAIEYKRGILAGLNVSLDISTEKVQLWLNRFKGCWKEEDFNKRKTITQEITNITQTKTEEKSTKELFAGVEI